MNGEAQIHKVVKGGYVNTNGKDSFHPDLNHPGSVEPHWDYNDGNGHYNVPAEKVAIAPDYFAIVVAIEGMNASSVTIENAKNVFSQIGTDGIFERTGITAITRDTATAAGNLINKMKDAGLIEAVSGFGKGMYKFTQK